MSNRSKDAKVAFLLEMISNIEFIVDRHGDPIRAIEDIEGRMALLMGILQIGETLKKLDSSTIEECDLLEIQSAAYFTRNYIAHAYENVDLYIIEEIIKTHIPELKEKLS
jgi:uncharacterized protein with HEPN domain